MKMRRAIAVLALALSVLALSGCSTAADVASANIATAADQFQIYRRVVFYNVIQDVYILEVKGYCSIRADTADNQLEVTVLAAPGIYLKHHLGLADNVTYFSEQLMPAAVSDAKYSVVFKPSVITPTILLD